MNRIRQYIGLRYVCSEVVQIHMPSGRVNREGHNYERPPGPLHAPPRVGHASGPGVGRPPPPTLPQM